jgi:glucose dehydrogenase
MENALLAHDAKANNQIGFRGSLATIDVPTAKPVWFQAVRCDLSDCYRNSQPTLVHRATKDGEVPTLLLPGMQSQACVLGLLPEK